MTDEEILAAIDMRYCGVSPPVTICATGAKVIIPTVIKHHIPSDMAGLMIGQFPSSTGGRPERKMQPCTFATGHIWRGNGCDPKGRQRARCAHCGHTVLASRVTVRAGKSGPKSKSK